MLTLVAYAANTQLAPDDAALTDADRWSMTDAPDLAADPGATSASLLPDGVLQIADPDTNTRRIYARYDALNESDDAVFEISCRVVSAGDSHAVGFGFIDTRKSLEVVLWVDQLGMDLLDGAAEGFAMDTTDALHTYRIVKTGSTSVDVFVDGVAALSVPYEQLADRTEEFPEHQRQVLSTSGANTSEWHIAYACYSISSLSG